MSVSKKTRHPAGKAAFAKILKAKRDELLHQVRERRQAVVVERTTEDEGGQASWAQMEHLAFTALEQEQKTLREIEAALNRMDRGSYGVCESCGEPIPEARLRALPWARYCVKCADQRYRVN
ncbi:MAG TPA: TraR/DksA family transcriptional regulator [Candidatus Acidoferrales bacterium]|nr:TraR/DksA family transcriptional regulator [Candidatus Acidoferrales bacterium]